MLADGASAVTVPIDEPGRGHEGRDQSHLWEPSSDHLKWHVREMVAGQTRPVPTDDSVFGKAKRSAHPPES